MFLADFLVALLVALLLTALFAAVFGTTGPWSGFWVYFLLILLMAWVAGIWVRPFGPAVWGVYWFPFLLFGLIAALLIAAATPPAPRGPRPGPGERPYRDEVAGPAEPDGEDITATRERPYTDEDVVAEGAAVTLGLFFWLLMLVLLIALIFAYL